MRKARAQLSGGGASSPPAQPCFSFPATKTAPVALEREGTGTRGAGGAGSRDARRLCFALPVPTSSRRLGPASSWCGLLPAWLFASLPFSLALRPPFFFPGRFSSPSSLFSTLFLQAPVDCARVPSCPWPSPRENKAILAPHPKPTSSGALGSAFAGSGLHPARWGEKGDSGVLLSARF